ncbi:MAG TPA: M1 family metallopeptidase, partial [Hyphomonadaceae bacterium]|nr:M1 family metallopeptidase [Hyphomonadaceae bacterium]
NTYRTASGAPGEAYWQQQADHVINATLDENAKRITASETVTYKNNSPHTLTYAWFQLDQNQFKQDSVTRLTATTTPGAGGADTVGYSTLRQLQSYADKPHGYEIKSVTDGAGKPLHYVINDTMMRVDLPSALAPGKTQAFKIAWAFNIVDNNLFGGRSGYERFPENDTYIFFQAQWFPRMVAYTDYTGWQHKQFLGRGEFTLEFGNFDVSVTLPADHIMGATGVLQNPNEVLSAEQRSRLAQAKSKLDKPMYIVSPDEALANEKEGTTATKTWRWKAQNVRDFAWASSRKFIWDAMGVKQPEGGDVLAQSFFPTEADPLWSLYSTRAVAHTIDVYSQFAFPYPYPNAISVNTWASGGMEYPMISFNGYRPVKDEKTGQKTYTRNAKYGLIGVVIHEVGHNYFPMVVNSDERQWTWMDEGLNSFLESQAELLWEEEFPVGSPGVPNVLDTITSYMTSQEQVPVMTNSESVKQFGPNAYTKPTAALTILRETVMGRELFDFAFKEYAHRWRFKRPTPADFFRTMEDASGTDLDWFWRGWFYTTDHVDVSLDSVREYRLSTRDPNVENPLRRERREAVPDAPTVQGNRAQGLQTYVDKHPDAKDFYNQTDDFAVNNKDLNDYQSFQEGLKEPEKSVFERAMKESPFIYFVDFSNIGGLVTPLPLKFTYADGTTKEMIIPAEIWRGNNEKVTKLFVEAKKVASIELDARHQIADADMSNNAFPQKTVPSRLELFRAQQGAGRNQMADALVELKAKEAPASGAAPITPSRQ